MRSSFRLLFGSSLESSFRRFEESPSPEALRDLVQSFGGAVNSVKRGQEDPLMKTVWRTIWSFEFCVPMTKKPHLSCVIAAGSAVGDEVLRIFTTEEQLISSVKVEDKNDDLGFFAARVVPEDVCRFMDQLKDVRFLQLDAALKLEWSAIRSVVQSTVASATNIRELLESGEDRQKSDAAIRSLIERNRSTLFVGIQKTGSENSDEVLSATLSIDESSPATMLFVADDMAAAACPASDFVVKAVDAAKLPEMAQEFRVALVYDVARQDGKIQKFELVDSERMAKIMTKKD